MLESNLQKAYALVHGQCTELMKSKLKSATAWEAIEKDFDVINLLDEIKKILTTYNPHNKYQMNTK